jgi:hypothetical protein
VISVVIPAHDEAEVIERCLSGLLAGAEPGELEVVVVCNGCSDDTAARARRFGPPVAVVETPTASKVGALNLGDAASAAFPRFYVDADVELDIHAVRDVAARLVPGSGVAVAAPRAVVAHHDRRWPVRSFYEVWTRMPYFTDGLVGAGVYAFSADGRSRFGEFPDVIADDEVARRAVPASERLSSPASTFTIHPPRSLRGVVSIMTRAKAGNAEYSATYGQAEAGTGTGRTLRRIAATPSTWLHAPVYLGVMAVAERRARRRLAQGNAVWERDTTSRTEGAAA